MEMVSLQCGFAKTQYWYPDIVKKYNYSLCTRCHDLSRQYGVPFVYSRTKVIHFSVLSNGWSKVPSSLQIAYIVDARRYFAQYTKVVLVGSRTTAQYTVKYDAMKIVQRIKLLAPCFIQVCHGHISIIFVEPRMILQYVFDGGFMTMI